MSVYWHDSLDQRLTLLEKYFAFRLYAVKRMYEDSSRWSFWDRVESNSKRKREEGEPALGHFI